MKTYSVITLGGTVLESGLTKEDAETEKQRRGIESNAPNYYHVREDKKAEKIASSPTLKEHLESRNKGKASAQPEEQMVVNPLYADMTRSELKKEEKKYDALQNEGHADGYNPFRNNYMVKKEQPKGNGMKKSEILDQFTTEIANELTLNGLDILIVDIASLDDDGWQIRESYISKQGKGNYVQVAHGDGHNGWAVGQDCYRRDDQRVQKIAEHLDTSAAALDELLEDINDNYEHLNSRDFGILERLQTEAVNHDT